MKKGFIESLTTEKVMNVFEKKGYDFFSKGAYNLNIFGIRAEISTPNSFDDLICVFHKNNKGENVEFVCPATTDPGTYWLEHPMNTGGTAILCEGQYKGAYALGTHYGHDALVQVLPLPCYRDNNKDGIIDKDARTITTGLYGINLHSAWWVEEADVIGNASAGCLVTKIKYHHKYIIEAAKQAVKIYGNRLTLTLLNENDFE